jgi:hypothetical protein
LLASITILAMLTASEIAARTRGLLLAISLDSTRASFTAAISPATTATVPRGFFHSSSHRNGGKKAFVGDVVAGILAVLALNNGIVLHRINVSGHLA